MKIGRLIAAAVVLAALGATLYWSNPTKAAQDATAAAGEPLVSIVSLKQEDISKLEIKKKSGDDVVLDRTAPGSDTWKITSPKPLDRRPRNGFNHPVRFVSAQGGQGG